jgi:hypothetical protein
MKEKIFLDPNLFEFLSKKGRGFQSVLDIIKDKKNFITDVKGLQEIVYRYTLIGETEKGYENAMKVRNEIEIASVTKKDLDTQGSLLQRYPNAKPRELLHVAVMINNGVKKIVCSPESNYKEIEDITVENIIAESFDI